MSTETMAELTCSSGDEVITAAVAQVQDLHQNNLLAVAIDVGDGRGDVALKLARAGARVSIIAPTPNLGETLAIAGRERLGLTFIMAAAEEIEQVLLRQAHVLIFRQALNLADEKRAHATLTALRRCLLPNGALYLDLPSTGANNNNPEREKDTLWHELARAELLVKALWHSRHGNLMAIAQMRE